MDFDMSKFADSLLTGYEGRNVGPSGRELFLYRAMEEFVKGSVEKSIFYQQRALFGSHQDLFFQKVTAKEKNLPNKSSYERIMSSMTPKDYELMERIPSLVDSFKSAAEYVDKVRGEYPEASRQLEPTYECCDYLFNITDPIEGIRKIADVAQDFPPEWTIVQIVKAPNAETVYKKFKEIQLLPAGFMISILRHARSKEIPLPVGLLIEKDGMDELYAQFGTISYDFREAVNVDPKDYQSQEAKEKYGKTLQQLNARIRAMINIFENYIFPWKFIFKGMPIASKQIESYTKMAYQLIDALVARFQFVDSVRVILSLAALHMSSLSPAELDAIPEALFIDEKHIDATREVFSKLQRKAPRKQTNPLAAHFPCILIVDERLDHLFWEELNVEQEFTRVMSMQVLKCLYDWHKDNIHSGFLHVNVKRGGCLINPDLDLPKSEVRLKSFFDYWTPHWPKLTGKKPHTDELMQFYQDPCYFYAGHGSGMQLLSGKRVAKLEIKSVVFLFGCDSSKLRSMGFHSEMLGPHFYYHAAKCPTVVGTILAALDAYMDGVATEIVSRWVSPATKDVIPWNMIDRTTWAKSGQIKYKDGTRLKLTIGSTPDYFMGSLGAVVALIHQRKVESKYYNTVPYVMRGLPVWNVGVQKFPHPMTAPPISN